MMSDINRSPCLLVRLLNVDLVTNIVSPSFIEFSTSNYVDLYSAFHQVIRLWYGGEWKYKLIPSSYDVSVIINPVNIILG